MYTISRTTGFKKALKRCIKRGLDINSLEKVIRILVETGSLPLEYKPHRLNAKFNFAWECHIQPDCLLVWEQDDTELTLLFINTGTHSDIFNK
ncbi:MAG: type II toxin-antitoxin system YafQ family toxin [Bacteroides sp.]|nr:type II toxin-antitoxin system YafQ family toxin [Bacteroides sp.]